MLGPCPDSQVIKGVATDCSPSLTTALNPGRGM